MQESAFFAWREKPLTIQLRKKWADTCTDISSSYLRKETGPSPEVAVDHPVCKIPQGSENIEASNPLHLECKNLSEENRPGRRRDKEKKVVMQMCVA